jgi:hypothetical protein
MQIAMRDRVASTLDEMLSPEDKIILRCVDCQVFLLPRELHVLRRRVKDILHGTWTYEVHELCPCCTVNLADEERMAIQQSSTFVYLTREQYEVTKRYERAGLLAPDFKGVTSLLVS